MACRQFIATGLWLTLAASGLGGCGDPVLSPEGYDRSCQTGDDCIVVRFGSCGCPCDHVAVSANERDRYDEDLREFNDDCDPKDVCACGEKPDAICEQGRCETSG